MPIRFRCAYCNQLMAISRRKAGTVVRCPKCAGDIIVPNPDGTQLPEGAAPPVPFDVDDFDASLADAPDSRGPTGARGELAPPGSSDDVSVVGESIKRRGLFIPMGLFFLFVGVVLLLLIGMFTLGYFMGAARPAPPPAEVPAPKAARNRAEFAAQILVNTHIHAPHFTRIIHSS